MDTETGEGVRGMKPTREELREALMFLLESNHQVLGVKPRGKAHIMEHRVRAFLDSGLTDNEREIVAEAIEPLERDRFADFDYADWESEARHAWALIDGVLAALAPIAEGKGGPSVAG